MMVHALELDRLTLEEMLEGEEIAVTTNHPGVMLGIIRQTWYSYDVTLFEDGSEVASYPKVSDATALAIVRAVHDTLWAVGYD